MALAGDFHTFPLREVLSWIALHGLTGTVHFTRQSTKKWLAFQDGALNASWSNDPRETLGQALVRRRLVSEETLFTALLQQEKDGRRLGAILTAEGRLTEAQLVGALRANAEEHVYDLFLWPDGRFDFRDNEPPAPELSRLNLPVRLLLEEARHRLEAWERTKERFPSAEVTFKVLREGHAVEDPIERQILGLAAAGKTLAAISLETRRSGFETALLLADLCDRGALTVEEVTAFGESDPVGQIIGFMAKAEESLGRMRFDAALQYYERVLAIDGLHQKAKKGLIAVADARKAARIRQAIPLDKVPVLLLGAVTLSQQRFDHQEGFVLSRINGQWDVRSILKLCPMPEEEALMIFVRLLDRKVIELT
jgi:Domain of unknown function (DUF4388)